MTIVKVNLHKVHAERDLNAKGGQIKINNNVSLKNVEDMAFDADGKKGLKFTFTFTCTYEPNLGKIDVEGQVLFVEETNKIEEIKKSWEKDKKVPRDTMEMIINAALHKGNVQAIKISEEVSLPSPLPLPKVKSGTIPDSPQPETEPKEAK
jgi:ribosomal protein L24